ncbi:hypothetical protein F2P81_001190 [Scophthalmus maximus]|uniref:Uncharacterized protein n=1 Tax=Scophthalmus maximus TaxID=52904 RepID=A0A6A4TL02_SCOMX|nr:hypothetical protein F2P81_001190 [Scophthalmus maximus]
MKSATICFLCSALVVLFYKRLRNVQRFSALTLRNIRLLLGRVCVWLQSDLKAQGSYGQGSARSLFSGDEKKLRGGNHRVVTPPLRVMESQHVSFFFVTEKTIPNRVNHTMQTGELHFGFSAQPQPQLTVCALSAAALTGNLQGPSAGSLVTSDEGRDRMYVPCKTQCTLLPTRFTRYAVNTPPCYCLGEVISNERKWRQGEEGDEPRSHTSPDSG